MRFSFLRLAYAFFVVLFLLLCSSVILPQSYQRPTEKYVDAALSSLPDLPGWVPWDDVESTRDVNRGQAVREAFLHTWKGYMEHAFPHDMLRPLTNKYEDDRYDSHISFVKSYIDRFIGVVGAALPWIL
jgi:Glycosyl hydrolase family 47